MTIHPIAPAQTYALRHAVLWPDQPLTYVQLPDDDAGQHFGAFEANELVAVISLFVSPDGMARFRKFATDPAWQGRGIGSALLRHTIAAAVAQGARTIWCDARQSTLAFYERFGLRPAGDIFYKGPIAYVRLQRALPWVNTLFMNLIETHAHLYSEQFKPDRAEALHRAVAAGVDTILLPNIDHRSIDGMLALEADYPQTCHAMMGLHPCSVGPDFEKELYLLEDWLGKRPFVAVGECGIDLYWDKTFLPQQQEALRTQLRLAKQYDLPIVLHTRSAFNEAFELVAEAQDGTLRGVFHCFSDGVAEAERIISLGGFKMGIGGVATFKNGGLDKVLPHLSVEHLVLETDCPYLAPVPYRGKRNEPAYLPLVLHRLAALLGQEPELVAEATTRNARELFRL